MSSPAASNAGDRKKPAEQITFRFCSECSNMLYPKEDEVDRKLMFTCRTCNFSEEATSTCIFRNSMNNAAGETAGVTQDVGSDPTVGASSSLCLGDAAAAARRRGSGSSDRSGASGVSACVGCGTVLACERCGDNFSMLPSDGRRTPELELDEASVLGLDHDDDDDDDVDTDMLDDLDIDLDEVEILPWTGESLDELGALVSRTEDFFGLRGMDEQAKTMLGGARNPVTTAIAHG